MVEKRTQSESSFESALSDSNSELSEEEDKNDSNTEAIPKRKS